jgi:hypothetical protein
MMNKNMHKDWLPIYVPTDEKYLRIMLQTQECIKPEKDMLEPMRRTLERIKKNRGNENVDDHNTGETGGKGPSESLP